MLLIERAVGDHISVSEFPKGEQMVVTQSRPSRRDDLSMDNFQLAMVRDYLQVYSGRGDVDRSFLRSLSYMRVENSGRIDCEHVVLLYLAYQFRLNSLFIANLRPVPVYGQIDEQGCKDEYAPMVLPSYWTTRHVQPLAMNKPGSFSIYEPEIIVPVDKSNDHRVDGVGFGLKRLITLISK